MLGLSPSSVTATRRYVTIQPNKTSVVLGGLAASGHQTAVSRTVSGVPAAAAAFVHLATFPGPPKTAVPWLPPPIGPELWQPTNPLYFAGSANNNTVSPSITADGTSRSSYTNCLLPTVSNADFCFRVKFDIDSVPDDGWFWVGLQMASGAGESPVAGSNQQLMMAYNAPWTGRFEMDFKANAAWALSAGGSTTLSLYLLTAANATGGTLAVSNMSVRQIAAAQRPISFAYPGDGTLPSIYVPLYDVTARSWRMAQTQFETAGADYLTDVTALSTDGFSDTTGPPDPDFLRATVTSGHPMGSSLGSPVISGSLRVNNNDQIIEVLKADGTWELRGNTHGGETLIAAAALEGQDSDGAWASWDGTGGILRQWARRFRYTFDTQIARSAPDGDVFATTSHVCMFFADGMMRCDRTTTFTKDTHVRVLLDWMSSHSNTRLLGRIGSAAQLLDQIDSSEMSSGVSDTATWTVWYDPDLNMCYGHIHDREAILARDNIAGIRMRIEQGAGIQKQYVDVMWATNPVPSQPGYSNVLVPAGTAWPVTHWAYTYVPSDSGRFHDEIASRSADPVKLKAMYPA